MGRFKAIRFKYDNINSETKNIIIGKLNGEMLSTSNILGTYESHIDKTNKADRFFSMGGSYTAPISESFFIALEEDVSVEEVAQINHWLFNRDNFLPLEILQDDLSDYVFYCKLLNPILTSNGGYPVMWECQMECDSSYAWRKEKPEYITTSKAPFVITNNSMGKDKVYPEIEIKSTANTNTVRITNNTTGKYFQITGLVNGEIIKINRVHKIKTSLGENVRKLTTTNMIFPALIYGKNNISITGSFEYVKLTFDEAVKVGG